MFNRVSPRDYARILTGARAVYATADELGLFGTRSDQGRARANARTRPAHGDQAHTHWNNASSRSETEKAFAADFNKIFEEITKSWRTEKQVKAAHNIILLTDNIFAIEIAVAGYPVDQVNVTEIDESETTMGFVVVEGKAPKRDVKFAQRGLAAADFKDVYELPKGYKVKNASFDNGVLTIKCYKVVEEKPAGRKIDIGTGK